MGERDKNEKLIIQYLLGDLSDEEMMRVEDHYFDDNAFFEEMTIVEEELIDDYLRGHLTGDKRRKFENGFLSSPARRKRVDLSKTLINSLSVVAVAPRPISPEPVSPEPVSPEPGSWFRSVFISQNRAFQVALGALALFIAVAAVWLAVENARLRNDVNQLQAERATLEQTRKESDEQASKERERNEELMAAIEKEQNDRQKLELQLAQLQPQQVAIFELASNLMRSGGATKSFNIPSGAKTVELKLYTEPSDYKIYRAILQTADGEKVWSKEMLKARTTASGKVVAVRLPAELFSNREYVLTLSGAASGGDYDNAGIYPFKVAKK